MDLDEKDRYTSTWNLYKGSWHSFDELGVKHTLRKLADANVWGQHIESSVVWV